MNEDMGYYVFIPCGHPANIIKAEFVHIDTAEMVEMSEGIEISPRFASIEEKDKWLTRENTNLLNDNLLKYVDKLTRSGGEEAYGIRVQLMSVIDNVNKGFNLSEIAMNLMGSPDFKDSELNRVLSGILESGDFKYGIPDDIRFEAIQMVDEKKPFGGILYPDKPHMAKVINLDDYRK